VVANNKIYWAMDVGGMDLLANGIAFPDKLDHFQDLKIFIQIFIHRGYLYNWKTASALALDAGPNGK
jgi:hypothetical protein